jgi:UDP-N-acetylglucosamine 2-epimerase (non-hydrolysing)/GDP/UDP-N,N'-diacetylbacillosamine 2-epimerase (hydrolysing)
MPRKRTICYVTGTRAEFGLMQSTLRAIQSHPRLRLQLIATGMHLDPAHGKTINQIRREGFSIDATVPWKAAGDNQTRLAEETGRATARLAAAFGELKPDIILVTGDRVEAFAAATAAHLSGKILAHVHGGDRAQGQVDDSLRHAITKLAHVHFSATSESAQRIAKLGEDKWRIHQVGSPGLDGITTDAWPLDRCRTNLGGTGKLSELASGRIPHSKPLEKRRYAMLLLHPTQADDRLEHDRAISLFHATVAVPFDHVLTIYPNNDPGSIGIINCWERLQHTKYRMFPAQLFSRLFVKDLPRPAFLGLLRDAAVLVGNSSAGIIEAASFGTPVLDVGPRQAGRQRGQNVTTVPFRQVAIRRALKQIWNNGHPRRYPRNNPYGAGDTAHRIAKTLAAVEITPRLQTKLIAY